MRDDVSPAKVVRRFFAGAAILFGAASLLITPRDPKLMAAAGAFGLVWTAWDLVMAWIVDPLLELFGKIGHGAAGLGTTQGLRPSLDDTIRYLHRHLEGNAAPRVKLQAGLRLEEIYRTVKKDEARARKVLQQLKLAFPDEALVEVREGLYKQ